MKIFCIGRNYVAHAKELNNEVPDSPVLFMKPPTAILKNKNPFYYPEFSKNVHYEGELVVKICKNGKHIGQRFARSYYNEISVGLDLTARDIQQELKDKKLPWELAKAFDGSAVIGTMVPLHDRDIQNIHYTLKKNGETVQIGHSALMIYQIDFLISYISSRITVQKGDLIYTGTPAGVGPIAIGDKFEGFIEGNQVLAMTVQ